MHAARTPEEPVNGPWTAQTACRILERPRRRGGAVGTAGSPRAPLTDDEGVHRLLAYTRPHLRALVVGTLLAVVAGAAGLVQPLLAKAVIDALSAGRPLAGPVALLALLVVLAAVLSGANSYVLGRTAERVVLDVRRTLARRLVRLRVEELDHTSPGDLISRTTADSSLLRSAATTSLVDLVDGGLRFAGALVFMGWLDLRLLAVSLTVLAGVAVTVGFVVPRIRAAVKAAQDAIATVARALHRALGAARTVKASGTEGLELGRVTAAVDDAYRAGVHGVRLNAVLSAVTGLSIQVPFLVVLGVGGALVASGQLPVSTLVAFLLYLFYLIGPIGQLVSGMTTLQQGLAAVDRIAAVEAMEVEDVPLGDVSADARLDGRAPAGHGGQALPVRFDGVGFGYPRRDRVLRAVSFEAPGPGVTAVVGPSGAGKTTLFSLLMRFYDLEEGTIAVGGTDIRMLPLHQLRRLIGYVEQDAPALEGTFGENLVYAAPSATEAQISAVLAPARLDELVERLPDGLETLVGTRGVLLSGGERQRLAIARALLRRPAVLLLDEATSQLDARNERALRDVVDEVAGTTTVLVVAHRLSTVTSADRIVVLDAGRVRATGTHEELLAADPLYAELAATQLLTADPLDGG
jgi:ABC-type multidrug transport system fused ATPase/permease subunit